MRSKSQISRSHSRKVLRQKTCHNFRTKSLGVQTYVVQSTSTVHVNDERSKTESRRSAKVTESTYINPLK